MKDEPIVLENNYLLKSELTMRISMFLFFSWLMSISLTPESDPLDEIYRKLTIGSSVLGFIVVFLLNLKMLKALIKNGLQIKIYDNRIIYEYVTEKGKKKEDIIRIDEITSKKWSFFPYAIRDTEIWITEIKDKDDKRWAYLFSIFYILVSLFYQLIFIVLNKFKVEKYLLYRFKDGIVAIPYDKTLFKEKFPFEWRSLVNRYIFKGGYYGK